MEPTGKPKTEGAGAAPPKVVHQSGFTMIRPNEDKARKIKRVAESESRAYDSYKQHQRANPSYYTVNGTVGGGPMSRSSSQPHRLTTQTRSNRGGTVVQSNRTPTTSQTTSNIFQRQNRIVRNQARANNWSDSPEALERHKERQRQKAESLKVKEEQKQRRLDSDRSIRNQQFLDRLQCN